MRLNTDDIRRFVASFQPTPAPVVVVVVTATPADTPTGTSTATLVPSLTPTSTLAPVIAAAPASTATRTPIPTATLRPTFTPTVTRTATSTATGTATGTPTTTPTVTATAFVCGRVEMVLMGAGKEHKHCHTPTPTLAPGATRAAAPTFTPVPANTTTPTQTATGTPIPTNTPRVVVVALHTNTPAPTATHSPPRTNLPLPTLAPTIGPLLTPLPLIPTIARLPTIAPIPTKVPIATAAPTRIPSRASLTTTDKPGIDTRRLEERTHELINAERVNRGLNPLEHIQKIRLIARSHSDDMAARNYFAHRSPEGLSPTDRGRSAGYNCRKDYGTYYTYGFAENIHQGWLYDSYSTRNGRIVSYDWFTPEGLARTAVSGWMSSKGHRENILKPSYDKAGIGVAIAEDGKVYFTQNFC